MSKLEYFTECIQEACADCGLSATPEQIDAIAESVTISYENMDLAFYQPPNPLDSEMAKLKAELKREQSKEVCPVCRGQGWITDNGGVRSSSSQCYKCHGNGKIIP